MLFLIVDDSQEPLRLLRQIITDMGHQVAGVARDGQEAVAQFDHLHPDVVVMDVIMPRMNGLEALELIMQSDPRARVVMASSMRSPETALVSQRRGARFFLYKPFREANLRNVIAKLARESQPS